MTSEFRQVVTTGEWVIIAGNRGERPNDFRVKEVIDDKAIPELDTSCPFCPGGAAESNIHLLTCNDKDGEWLLRVDENRFAALSPHVSPKRYKNGDFSCAGGYGRAEVIIESKLHNVNLTTMSTEHVVNVLTAYKERYNALAADTNINVINIFKNQGAKAGASLLHPHSQIIGSSIVTTHITNQIHHARVHYDNNGECVYCQMIRMEREQKERVLIETEYFIAICPFASKSPYEIRVLPKRHSSLYGNISDSEIIDFAGVLQHVLLAIKKLLGDPDYNYIIRSVTTNDGEVQYYHWYMVIIPKVNSMAGFEIGTGICINPISPELAAESLRSSI